MIDTQTIDTEALRSFCLAVAPELLRHGFYLAAEDQFPEATRKAINSHRALAVTHHDLSTLLGDKLPGWTGKPAACVVVCREHILSHAPRYAASLGTEDLEGVIQWLAYDSVLHETAHVLQCSPPYHSSPRPGPEHGKQWMRLVLLLNARAESLGLWSGCLPLSLKDYTDMPLTMAKVYADQVAAVMAGEISLEQFKKLPFNGDMPGETLPEIEEPKPKPKRKPVPVAKVLSAPAVAFHDLEIKAPQFPRMTEYFGLWSLADSHATALYNEAKTHDCKAAMALMEPVRSYAEKMTVNNTTIAVVKVTGVMMKGQSSLGGCSTIQLRRDIRQAAMDPGVSSILLCFESPGGTVAGIEDLAAEIRSARQFKPVVAHVDDLCASAAFWAASQCEAIYANGATALLGSVGTMQCVYDCSAQYEREGIKTLLFKTGDLKALGTPGAPITEAQIAHLQQLTEDVQASFDAAVMKGRKLSAQELADVRHGGVMTATEAVRRKLIDGIQPLAKTMDQLAKP